VNDNGKTLLETVVIDQPVPGAASPHAITPTLIDLIVRRRNTHGHRLPWHHTWSVPPVEDDQLTSSWLEKVFAHVEMARPMHAHHLRWFYGSRLLPAHERLRRVRREVEQEHKDEMAAVERHNAQIDGQIEALKAERDRVAASLKDELVRREVGLENAHRAAAVLCGAVGGSYDPADPRSDAALVPPTVERARVLGQEALPDPTSDSCVMMFPGLAHLATVLVGALMGISIALIAGFLDAARMDQQLPLAILWAVFGQGPAWFMRKAMSGWSKIAAEVSYAGSPWPTRLGAQAWAGLWVLASLAVHAAVDSQGLLSMRQSEMALRSLSHPQAVGGGGGVGDLVLYVTAMSLVLGYCSYAALEGWFAGRRLVIENHVARVAGNLLDRYNEGRRALPEVRKALQAINEVLEARRQRELAGANLDKALQPSNDRIAELDACRRHVPDSMPQMGFQRIQDAYDNLQGALIEFEFRLEPELLEEGTLLERFWAWLRPYRRMQGRA